MKNSVSYESINDVVRCSAGYSERKFSYCLLYQSLNGLVLCRVGGGGRKRGTQQENSCTKHTVTNRLSVTAKLGRVKEAPATLEFVNEVPGQTFLQKVCCE